MHANPAAPARGRNGTGMDRQMSGTTMQAAPSTSIPARRSFPHRAQGRGCRAPSRWRPIRAATGGAGRSSASCPAKAGQRGRRRRRRGDHRLHIRSPRQDRADGACRRTDDDRLEASVPLRRNDRRTCHALPQAHRRRVLRRRRVHDAEATVPGVAFVRLDGAIGARPSEEVRRGRRPPSAWRWTPRRRGATSRW